ncbi:MAG: hypothetical protein AB1782_04685 [Cyanobacteriota bacterium]
MYRFIVQGLLITLLSFFVLQLNFVFAVNPSPEDLSYAKKLIVLYKAQEESQKSLQNEIIKSSTSINSAKSLAPFFVKNLTFIKKFYTDLYALKPTPVFESIHNTLLNAAYKHLQFLTKTIKLCEQNVDLATFQKHSASKAPIVSEYTTSMNNFSKIVDSWPANYADQVKKLY